MGRHEHDDRVVAAAVRQARHDAAPLNVLHVIDIGKVAPEAARDAAHARSLSADRQERRAEIRAEVLDQLAHLWDGGPATFPVDVRVEHGDPATVLLTAARGCRMIVLGVRSAQPRSPFLLGSVSQDVVVHAACPVLLIPQITGVRR